MKSKRNKLYTKISRGLGIACTISIALAQTSFAPSFVEKIVKSVSLGHVTVMEYGRRA